MKIRNNEILACISVPASFSHKSLVNRLKTRYNNIELSELLSFFYKNLVIEYDSTTLKKIIYHYFGKIDPIMIPNNSPIVLDFIKKNKSLNPTQMAHALETMHRIMRIDSLYSNGVLMGNSLATIVKTTEAKELIPLILQEPGVFFLVVMANTNLEPIFQEFAEFSPIQLERTWLFKTRAGNNILKSVIKSQINLVPILEHMGKLDRELQAQLWGVDDLGPNPLTLALRHPDTLEAVLKSIEGIPNKNRLNLWIINDNNNNLINAIDSRVDINMLLRHLEPYSIEDQYTLWKSSDSFGNAGMHVLAKETEIRPILEIYNKFSREQQLDLWKNKEGFRDLLSVALTDSRVTAPNRIKVLEALDNFTQNEQLELWQHKGLKKTSCLMSALQTAQNFPNSPEIFDVCYAAISQLTQDQQYQLWSTHQNRSLPLFLALKAKIPAISILKLFENLDDEHQFELLMAKDLQSNYYLTKYLDDAMYEYTMKLTKKMGKEFWPDTCKETHNWLANSKLDEKFFTPDETWEFYSLVQPVLNRYQYVLLHKLSLQPEPKQIAFYLWQVEGKFPFISYALEKKIFEKLLEAVNEWSMVKQIILLNDLKKNKDIYFPDPTYLQIRFQSYTRLLRLIEVSINEAFSHFDDLDSKQHLIKNRFNKLTTTKKVEFILASEHIKERDPVNYLTNLFEGLKVPESALSKALNISKAKLKLFDSGNKTPVKKISGYTANFDVDGDHKKDFGANSTL